MRLWGSGFRIQGPWFRDLGFGFRVQGFGLKVWSFGVWVSGFGFRISGPGFRTSGFGFRVSEFGFSNLEARAEFLREERLEEREYHREKPVQGLSLTKGGIVRHSQFDEASHSNRATLEGPCVDPHGGVRVRVEG